MGLVLVIALAACTQSPPPNDKYTGGCNLKIENSPEVRGLKLGMSLEQVKAKYPKLAIPSPDEVGHTYISIDKRTSKNVDSGIDLEGVNDISLYFLDNRLSDIRIEYENKPELKTSEEFRSRLSEVLRLPTIWGLNSIECYDFRVSATFDDWSQTSILQSG